MSTVLVDSKWLVFTKQSAYSDRHLLQLQPLSLLLVGGEPLGQWFQPEHLIQRPSGPPALTETALSTQRRCPITQPNEHCTTLSTA